jgi:DNA-binding NtrC family response regulator
MKIKILLVDDEKEFVDTLSERLEMREFDVSVAYSGVAAIGLLDDQSFDVIVLDVLMPGMDGIETLKRMKELAPLTQIIMLTGNATVGNAISGMKHGAYDFLLKPVETRAFVKKINAAFDIKNAQHKRIAMARIEDIVTRRGW